MRLLAFLAALFDAIASVTSLLRDRQTRRDGWDAAVAAGARDADERAEAAQAAAAASRADPDLLHDDGHRRDEP
jgi:hypothetical protein